jgi:hypothetical protein
MPNEQDLDISFTRFADVQDISIFRTRMGPESALVGSSGV